MTLNFSCDDFVLVTDELVIHNTTLSFANLLHDDLLSCLCSQTSEVSRCDFETDFITDFVSLVQFQSFFQRNLLVRLVNFFNDSLN